MFGDIIKVTPTSKAVGDLALHIDHERSHPRGGSRPREPDRLSRVRRAALSRRYGPASGRFSGSPATQDIEGACGRLPKRPGATLPPVDLEGERAKIPPETCRGRSPMRIWHRTSCIRACGSTTPTSAFQYGDVGILPTAVFFYGMEPGDEISVNLERGKTLIVLYITDQRSPRGLARARCSLS